MMDPRDAGHQACACLRVRYVTVLKDGYTTGWHVCELCGNEFIALSRANLEITDLTARLAAAEERRSHFEDLAAERTRLLGAAEESEQALARGVASMGLEIETLTAALAQANQERDDLQAWIDRAERKGAIDANMLSAPDDLTPPPGGGP